MWYEREMGFRSMAKRKYTSYHISNVVLIRLVLSSSIFGGMY